MDNYNFYTTEEDNKTFSEDGYEDNQKLTVFMLSRQKIVPDLSITASPWLVKPELGEEEFLGGEHIRLIKKARKEYQEGKIISEDELFKIINKQEKEMERKSSSFLNYLKGVVSDPKVYWTKEDSAALSKIRKKSLQRLRKLT